MATYHAELSRDGPGLLLRDILKGDDPQLLAFRAVLAETSPDILLVQGVDYDHGQATLAALQSWLRDGGVEYPYAFSLPPNAGVPTGLDMDGDGRLGEPEDNQGFGRFYGEGGMALLSRYPIGADMARDFSGLLWADLPGALLPQRDGAPFPSAEAQAVLRLASVAHWMVPVETPSGPLVLMAFHAAPPVFDGVEDRNGRRNHDQLIFWRHLLDGAFGAVPEPPFVLIGNANLDPEDGDGRREAIRALLTDPRLQDPEPARPRGPLADHPGHAGDPRLDTVAWPAPDPGHRRVSYVLPSAEIVVRGAGVYWPPKGDPAAELAATASRHRLVWVDMSLN
ncbi:endonuclease/exonuclease/phosphatase family protein [Roseovarius faecimaris]|uniref:endonuclease/exonuclease/phosphatase family protein n=1 Tax=Roseovarius faecimaris TaxID=2494550 RepID=UPI001FE7C8F4|nr:endonuclease/exonuclease/phosphatase family protein [Roseovarius faecimaris]